MFKKFMEDFSLKSMLLKGVYQTIHQYGPISKAELLQKTKLKQTTLSRMVEELLKSGFIRESGLGESAGGRRPVLYHIDQTCGYIIGVHITRIRTKIVLYDLLYNPLDQFAFAMTFQYTPTIVIRKIIQTILQFMDKFAFTEKELLGIGIASIGPLDRQHGIILSPEELGSSWQSVRIADILQQSFPVKIILENGPNTAVLGESNYASLPFKNILYCVSGWGVGSGVMIDGELIRDNDGDVTGNGHMIIDIDGRVCSCGKKGCLISYMSLTTIVEELQKKDPSINWNDRDRSEVLDLFQEHNDVTEEIILKSAYYYGIGLANMITLYHSEILILSGLLIYSYPNYYQKVVDSIYKHLNKPNNVKVSQGILKDNAAVFGAAVLIFQSFFYEGNIFEEIQ